MTPEHIPGFTPQLPQHHHRPLVKNIFQVGARTHVFVGWTTSVFSAVIGPEGWVLIDTGDDAASAREALKEIRALTDKPLAGVILTHSHADHTLGAAGFLENERGDIPVWSRACFGGEQAGFRGLERITGLRAGRQFGRIIPLERYTVNSFVPNPNDAFSGPSAAPLRPNQTFAEERRDIQLGGLTFELYAAPGETSDQLNIRLPDENILFCGDNMYQSFPNLYPIRGAGYRDVAAWAASLRRMRALNPTAVVMGHTDPVFGGAGLDMMDNYAAAIQYVLDATLQGMNEGRTPDELAAEIRLPEHLRGLEYLGEFYGCLPWAVRSIFAGHLGWFDGNPTNLVPLAPLEEAERMAALAGGADNLLPAARKALQDKDYRWAVRLADICLRLPVMPAAGREEAAAVKADALEALSEAILPITGRNYLMSCALELRQKNKPE